MIPYREIMRRKDNDGMRALLLAWCAAFIVTGFFLCFLATAMCAGGHR